jgi:hypothetical protein
MDGRLLEVGQVHRDLSQPRTRNPAPLTKRRPPLEKRTALAIFLAMSTSGVFRKTL